MAREINALIVDDSMTTRKLIMRALDQTGLADFNFTEAEDGIDGLAKYQPGEIELLLIDMNMPRMGGIELIRKLRTQHRSCPPAIMITAESSRDRLLEAINEPGVDAFLLKPIDRDRLQTGLRQLIDAMPARAGMSTVPNGECVPLALEGVLSTACGLKTTRLPPSPESTPGQIVKGMISIYGGVHWSVTVGFEKTAAELVATGFAGYAIDFDSDDLGDAIGEIVNITGGAIKSLLGQRELEVKISLPMVVTATDFRILLHRQRTRDTVRFESSAGLLWTTVTAGIDPGMIL